MTKLEHLSALPPPQRRTTMSNKIKLFTSVLPACCRHLNIGFILLFYSTVFLSSSLTTTDACELITVDWVEKTIEERTALADIVASGRVIRQHQPGNRNKTNFLYAADIKILDIYKGYRHFENVATLGEKADNVYRVLGFGDRKKCFSEAHENQEYIFFLTPYSMSSLGFDGVMGLTAKYNDFHGAVDKLSNKHEMQVLSTLGWKPWSSWNTCPVSCGGGVQRRRRLCVKDVPDACEGSAEQLRNCNEFGCTGQRNLLQILELSFFPKGVRRTPLRWQSYRIRAFANLRQPTTTAFPHGFPQEFSVIMSIRPKYNREVEGDLFVFVVTDQDGDIEFGIQLGDVPHIVYSETTDDGQKVQHSEAFTEYPLGREWHTMAFSIRGATVSLHVECSTVFKHRLVAPIRVDSRGMTAIGSPVVKSTSLYYEGDVEQLVVIGDSNAAQLQCVEPQHLMPTLSSHQPSASSPWDIQTGAAESLPTRLLIPPSYFKSWTDNYPRPHQVTVTKVPNAKHETTSSSPQPRPTTTIITTPVASNLADSNRRWDGHDNDFDVGGGAGQENWFQITLPPHLVPNLIPLAREILPKPLTPASGAVDINMLPPPFTADPLMPKPPANIVGDQVLFPAEGVHGQLGVGDESNGGSRGFGELLSGTPGRNSGKEVSSDGRDGGHDVPFDVTVPQQYWRGDSPPEGYFQTPRRLPTTHAATTSAIVTPFEDYVDFSSSSSSSLPIDSGGILPSDYSEAMKTPPSTSATTSQSTTKEPEPTTTKPEPTTTKPESTTTKPEPTTTKPEPTTTKPEPTTTKPEPTTTKPETTTTKPEPTTTKPEPTTTKPEPTTTKPEPTTTKPEPTTTKPEPTTTKPEPPTTKPEPTTTKPFSTRELRNPTTEIPTTATTTPDPTTTLASTTATVTNILNNVIDAILGTTRGPLVEITTAKEVELSNLIQNDAGVIDRNEQKPPQDSAEETDTTWWSSWSTCSKSCDTGIRYRFTFCTKDSKKSDCIRRGGRGVASETKTCHVRDCEAPRGPRWSAWSECSRSCGEGYQTRMALCLGKATIPECVGRRTAVQRKPCTGTTCACSPSCQNGGSCKDGSCDCRNGFTGSQCQTRLRSYSRCNPRCANGGICSSSGRCGCREGFRGPACQTAICAQGCRNGGRCVAPGTCTCAHGYRGHDCSQPICQSGCRNGGVCVRPDLCRCPVGYRGPQCQLFKCRRQCRNGGRCVGPDKCSCSPVFKGDVCQISSCYGGCPVGSRCVSPGRCASVGDGRGGTGNSYRLSSYSANYCRLTSYTGTIKQSYVKPEVKTIQTRCGPDLRSLCPRTRVQYSRHFRTLYKTMYRMICKEPT